jgi:2'-5' RNA ligase
MRCFIALDISAAVRDEFAGLLEDLKASGADVKWTEPQNLHLTLKFLGEIGEDKVEKVKQALEGLVSQSRPFAIRFAGLGSFGDPKHPRVLWVGVEEGRDELKNLALKIETQLQALGFEKEPRSFSAHLTLGRVRTGRNLKALIEKLKTLSFSSKNTVKIDRLFFYKSTLTQQGPVHEVLSRHVF